MVGSGRKGGCQRTRPKRESGPCPELHLLSTVPQADAIAEECTDTATTKSMKTAIADKLYLHTVTALHLAMSSS